MSNQASNTDSNFQLTEANYTKASAEIDIKDVSVNTHVKENYFSRYIFSFKCTTKIAIESKINIYPI